ncbi:hypothetical protein MNBD_CHLOROFLEXI01-1838 [hydrothermal vent metagenome]|uniref:Uncharacterized protein n=1 Tax=hydrothermal vent metagenome TaxID=652676 RepID=A0A3B0V009_9ZZZZ
MLSMNISDQISAHWAAHREEIGLVWYLLPNQGQPSTNETAANLQQQITSYLLMTPFAPEAGRLVGEQLAQQFHLSIEKLGYLQGLLIEQLLLGLDEAQTVWLTPRLTAFWAEMTVGYGYQARKLYLAEQGQLPKKLLTDLQQAAEGKQHFAALFSSTYSPVVLHENGRILAINKAVTQIFGYTADELVGQQIQALVSAMAPAAEQTHILKHITAELTQTYQTKCFSKDGVEIALEVTTKHIIHEGRKVCLIVLRPLTDIFKPLPESEEVNLTSRQQEVLHYLAAGMSDKEIATTLHISLPTVKHHKQEIFNKLQVTTRIEAASWAWQG